MLYNDPETEMRLARFAQCQRDQRLEFLRRSTPLSSMEQPAPMGLVARVGGYLGQIRPLTRRTA